MKIPLLFFFAVAILVCSNSASAKKSTDTNKKPNDIESLFRPSRITGLTMSPDGKYVAGLAPMNGEDAEVGLVIYELEKMKIIKTFKWAPGHDIYGHHWLDDDSVGFKVSKWDAWVAGYYRIDVNRPKSDRLIGNDAAITVIDSNEETTEDAWIWIRGAGSMKPGLARLKKNGTSSSSSIVDNPLVHSKINEPLGDVYWWYVDHANQARIVSRFHEDKLEYLLIAENRNNWKPIPLDPEDWDIELFHEDNNQIYVAGYNGNETKGLYLYNLQTNELSDVLYRDDYYDFSETARYRTFKNQLLGIQYDRDVPSMVWFSDEMIAIQKMVDSALPEKANVIYDWDKDLNRLLVYSFSDTIPPSYLLLDLKNRSLKEISKSAPWLDNDSLSKTEVFHFKTSDGLRLEGFLTRPTTGQAPYPTIALVHGGPWVRDFGTYDEEAQFLASQGYAVLKVNYRGSSGYGKRISDDPEYDYKAMNRDITEAVQTAIKSKIVDPDRIAIMGASFGGYAAMCGATFEPDLYKCAITNMGVFDWEEMIKDRKRQKSRYSYKKLVEELGDPKKGSTAFEEISPIYHVDKIKIPIFIIHGKNDGNVSIRQSKSLKNELDKAKIEYETYFVGGEGHNIFDMKKRVKTYEKVAEFLDKHMN